MVWAPKYDGDEKLYVSNKDAPKRIKELQFQPMTPQQMVQISECATTTSDLYTFVGDGTKVPAKGGALDPRLVGVLAALEIIKDFELI